MATMWTQEQPGPAVEEKWSTADHESQLEDDGLDAYFDAADWEAVAYFAAADWDAGALDGADFEPEPLEAAAAADLSDPAEDWELDDADSEPDEADEDVPELFRESVR